LGRGLEALLSRIPAPEAPAAHDPPTVPFPSPPPTAAGGDPMVTHEIQVALAPTAPAEPPRIETRLIDSNPYQPRGDFDESEIQSLAESLQAHGLLQPVVVRRQGERYQLIAGQRRLRAAVKAGWSDVPAQVVEADDRQVAELAIVENMQRKDLSPLEKAAAFQRYLEEYGATQEELASRLKLDRSTIANLIRLLELPAAVQDALRRAKITQGHARALLSLGDEQEQVAFCTRIQEEGLSVRQTERLVQEAIAAADAEPLAVAGNVARPRRSQHLAELEQAFRAALGLKVKLTETGRGKGKLVIPFATHEEFQRIHDLICGEEKPAARARAG
jgi:ParB family chromosome partitioning protein